MEGYEQLIGVMITVVVMIIGISLFTMIMPMNDQLPSEKWCSDYNQTELSKTVSVHPDYNYWCVRNETGWHLNKSRPMVLENTIR